MQLFKHAAFSSGHCRFDGIEDDHRLPYKRDVDRIVHSKAFSRYVDKTQVAYLIENDHITHRSLHVQLVSNFARGIAEILALNVDLVEAIALGHDVGHPPFGHEGERYLSGLSKKYTGTAFTHPVQSVRLFKEIEPLNLGFAVYDGFLCHDGSMKSEIIQPHFGKTWSDHEEEIEAKKKNGEINLSPATLEGALVKICDTMSYIGRDIEDAIFLGILKREDIPDYGLGRSNREILGILAQDLIEQSYEKEYITLSKRIRDSVKKLRAFNFQKIYTHPLLKVESLKIRRSYEQMFHYLLEDYEKNTEKSYLWKKFLWNKATRYLEKTASGQMVVDYIAGMTDSYFVRTLEEIFVPQQIRLHAMQT
ncbi:MAG: deoxyguanosinetriphosphate triphosphohydrolase [Waddliaceae bacterium]|nr:deoxyguanosinetriphosphate triphosphohydrolase [Waddliaceae bacterium]